MVIVFDDITTLLAAQRDAAWGEVARRLAHEIKNPLTPIQLSAERLRRKLLGSMNAEDAQLLERATHTIVQQVDAMKQMVNAFSEYARAPDMKLHAVRPEPAGHRGRRAVPRCRIRRCRDPPGSRSERCRKSRPTAARMRQILHNLITNGIEALAGMRGRAASRSARGNSAHDGGQPAAVICVSDNGPGFQRRICSAACSTPTSPASPAAPAWGSRS